MNFDTLFIPLLVGGCAVFAGVVTFLVTRRDLRGWRLVAVPLTCALLVGATSLFIPYLPVLALLGTGAVYLVLRRLISVDLALAGSGIIFFGGLSTSVLLMMMALETM